MKLSPHCRVIFVMACLSVASVRSAWGESAPSGEATSVGSTPYSETIPQMQLRDADREAGYLLSGRRPVEPDMDRPIQQRFPHGRGTRAGGASPQSRGQPLSPLSGGALRPGAWREGQGAPLAPQAIDTSFIAVNRQQQLTVFGISTTPPDTMGAIGPNHFMEVINRSVSIYSRTGTLLSIVTLDSFFTLVVGPITYPQNGAFDPRALYDRRSGRWFACALERGNPTRTNNHILLAVSRTDDPTTTIWDKYVIPMGQATSGGTTFFTDFDTLGTDDNGVYFGGNIFPSTGGAQPAIAATAKASLLAGSPSLSAVTVVRNLAGIYASPQPAHNQDAVGPTDPAWFVSSSDVGPFDLHYRTLTWSGGVPTLTGTTIITTPDYDGAPNAPALGSTTNINVTDDRLIMAVIRNQRLWTTRNVGVNSGGTSAGADRAAGEWLELEVATPPASLVQSGRIFDTAAGTPRHYYFPSVAVSGQGHAAFGFSGSKSTEFVGAYTCGRLAGDPPGTTGTPTLIKSGEASYNRNDTSGRNRWGDYSYTTIDPNDDMSLWTIQEYATNLALIEPNIWGTWVAKLLAPAPTLDDPAANVEQGATLNIPLTGTGFYDPGPGYANRLEAAVSGADVNVLSVTYNDSTSATIQVQAGLAAALGARDITLTNPDGQTATAIGGLTVIAAPTPCGTCVGDLDGNNFTLGTDIQGFVGCFLAGTAITTGCPCADMDADGQIDDLDVPLFTDKLLGVGDPDPECP